MGKLVLKLDETEEAVLFDGHEEIGRIGVFKGANGNRITFDFGPNILILRKSVLKNNPELAAKVNQRIAK